MNVFLTISPPDSYIGGYIVVICTPATSLDQIALVAAY